MVNDPISDIIIQIKNAYMARLQTVRVPYSRLKKELVDILVKEGFAKEVKIASVGAKKELVITLAYENKKPILSDVKIISKPSLRVYVPKEKIPRVLGGFGICILSTSKGLMTGKRAKKEGIGGQILVQIW